MSDKDADLTTWRGVAAEHADDIPHQVGTALRERSRRLLASLLRPHRALLSFLVVLVVVENGSRLAVPWLIRQGIDLGLPPLLSGGGSGTLIGILVALLVVVTTQATSRIAFLDKSGRLGQDVLLDLRRRLFRKFQALDVAFHDKYTSGRVVSRMTSDVEAIQEMLSTGFDGLITAILTLLGTALMMLVLDLRLGLTCLLGFPLVLALVRWFRNQSSITYRDIREKSALVIVQFIETMTGIRAVQAYRREPRNQEIFDGIADLYRRANERAFRIFAVFMPGINLIGNITTGVALLYGGHLVLDESMTIGTLTAFLLYLRQFFQPMQEISQFYNTYYSAVSALEKLSGVLEEEASVVEPEHPTALPAARGELDLNHVGFSYVEERVILADLDLHVPAGQTLALVGTTGAGKTTIAKLVARFYDPTAGQVTLDGIDLRELSDDTLRRHVVMVTQENFMFDGSIADNIRFGQPEATEQEIEEAARAVGAHDFIMATPQGYQTDVAKRGGRLSAGQRQLVAFARAFLANPAVLILDEATSSLDVPSERLVQHALTTLLADRTAVIIAHRLSTVEIADRVLVLEHGRIIEDGAPSDLIHAEDGRYAALHQAWIDSLA